MKRGETSNYSIPRITKINHISNFIISCVFNHQETRFIDFNDLFKQWDVQKKDIEYPLLDNEEFQKVVVQNDTLSWANIPVYLLNEDGTESPYPYELSPDILYKNSYSQEQLKGKKTAFFSFSVLLCVSVTLC